MVTFIDENRDDFEVEPICTNKKRAPSARALRDAVMMPVLLALFQANYKVYGYASCGSQRHVPVTTSAVTR